MVEISRSRQVANLGSEIVSVTDFGAVGDGVADDTVAIQAALDYTATLGRGSTLYIPSGEYKISSALIMNEGIIFKGDGMGSDSAASSQPDNPASMITATHTGTMLDIVSTTSTNFIFMAQVLDMYFKGENLATRAIRLQSGNKCRFRFGAERCTVAGLVIDDGNSALAQNNYIDYLFFQAGSNALCDDAVGLLIHDVEGTGTTRTRANYINVTGGKDGYGVRIGDHDAGYFDYVNVNVKAGGTGRGFLFDDDSGAQPRVSRKNHIGYLNGSITCRAGSRNTIGMINSEPSDVIIQGDAVLDYNVIDRNNGGRWSTFRYKMADTAHIDFTNSFSISGSASAVKHGTINAIGLSYPDAADSKNGVTIPIPREWTQGDIIDVDLIFYAIGGSNGQVVTLEVGIAARNDTAGTGSGLVVSGNQDITITTVNAIQTATITVTTPVTDTSEILVVQVERKGNDGDDSLTAALLLLGVKVNFVSDGPHSDPDNYDSPVDIQ